MPSPSDRALAGLDQRRQSLQQERSQSAIADAIRAASGKNGGDPRFTEPLFLSSAAARLTPKDLEVLRSLPDLLERPAAKPGDTLTRGEIFYVRNLPRTLREMGKTLRPQRVSAPERPLPDIEGMIRRLLQEQEMGEEEDPWTLGGHRVDPANLSPGAFMRWNGLLFDFAHAPTQIGGGAPQYRGPGMRLQAGFGITISEGDDPKIIAVDPDQLSGSANFADQEELIGTIDGVNTAFTLPDASPVAGSVTVFRNGILQRRTTQCTVAGNIVTFAVAPQPANELNGFTDDWLCASYRYT